jgi:hypothetical protein
LVGEFGDGGHVAAFGVHDGLFDQGFGGGDGGLDAVEVVGGELQAVEEGGGLAVLESPLEARLRISKMAFWMAARSPMSGMGK